MTASFVSTSGSLLAIRAGFADLVAGGLAALAGAALACRGAGGGGVCADNCDAIQIVNVAVNTVQEVMGPSTSGKVSVKYKRIKALVQTRILELPEVDTSI